MEIIIIRKKLISMSIICASLTVRTQSSPRFHVEAWLFFRNREMDYYIKVPEKLTVVASLNLTLSDLPLLRYIMFSMSNTLNPRKLEGGRVQISPSRFIFGFKCCSLTDCQKLWHNCSLFVSTSFDTN